MITEVSILVDQRVQTLSFSVLFDWLPSGGLTREMLTNYRFYSKRIKKQKTQDGVKNEEDRVDR